VIVINTVKSLALRDVRVVGRCEKAVTVTANNPFDITSIDIEKEAFHIYDSKWNRSRKFWMKRCEPPN
jgi:hypothetical protein